MNTITQTLLLLGGFGIVAVAAHHLAKIFQRFKLPLITGLLIIGILSGPFVFKLLPTSLKTHLSFISDMALAYIAFAAGAELYLKELKDRINSIKWITISQLVLTFVLGGTSVYLLVDFLPFLQDVNANQKLIVALMSGVIFVARSPASAIAIINEVRAKGPFTHTVLGVTVLKDFIVIILFAVSLSVSVAIDESEAIKISSILFVLLEMLTSFVLGLLLSRVLSLLLLLRLKSGFKKIALVVAGYSIYVLYYFIEHYSGVYFGDEFHIEPLLVCIIASFIVTNYSKNRQEYLELLKDIGPPIYVMFFTLAGANLSLDIISDVWVAALVFFTIRVISIIISSYIGGRLAGDPPLFNRIGWMPYITQAGVGLGLALIVGRTFPEWGFVFSTIITAMIVANEIVGPPLFKWALSIVKETHTKADPTFDRIKDAVIFGLENQSIALSKQLISNHWKVQIITGEADSGSLSTEIDNPSDFEIHYLSNFSKEELEKRDIRHSEAVVLMLTDADNLRLAEMIYENFGVKEIIVRLNDHKYFQKFHELGVLIVNPSTAIVSLLDHFVRTPQAATLLMGMQEGQDTMDIEVRDRNLHGIALRELRLPSDTILLSIKRGGHLIITHGYSRLRRGDIITVVGSKKSLRELSLKFEG